MLLLPSCGAQRRPEEEEGFTHTSILLGHHMGLERGPEE